MKKFITILLAVLIALPLTSCTNEANDESTVELFADFTAEEFTEKYNEALKSNDNMPNIPTPKKKVHKNEGETSSVDAELLEQTTTNTNISYTSSLDKKTRFIMYTDKYEDLNMIDFTSYISKEDIEKEENQFKNNPYVTNLIKCASSDVTEDEANQLAEDISYNSLSEKKKKHGEINKYLNYTVFYDKEHDGNFLACFIVSYKFYTIRNESMKDLGDLGFVNTYNLVLSEPSNNFEKNLSAPTPRFVNIEDNSSNCMAKLKSNENCDMFLTLSYKKKKLCSFGLLITTDKPFDEEMHDIATNSSYKKALISMIFGGYYTENADDILKSFKSNKAGDDPRYKERNGIRYMDSYYQKTDSNTYNYFFEIYLRDSGTSNKDTTNKSN